MLKKSKHVLMIMFGKQVGGAELQFIELANYLADKFSVRLISLGGDVALRSAQIDPRIEIQVYCYCGMGRSLWALGWAFLSNILFSSKYIVTTSFVGNYLGWAISLFGDKKLISLQTVSRCMGHPVVDSFVLRRFDALVAGALDIKEYLVLHRQDPYKIHVIHNWVDFSKRKPNASVLETRRKLGLGEQIIIGCVGRLHAQKGQVYLVRAFAKVLASFPHTILLLVGDGDTRGELEKEVIQLELVEKVVFAGTATGNEYNNLFEVIDVYVQPSVFEGLPRTLLDAMYMGKAIVATDINGNREAIENEVNGLLVRSSDAEALSMALLRLLRDHVEREKLSKQARKSALDNFSMVKKLREIENLLLD